MKDKQKYLMTIPRGYMDSETEYKILTEEEIRKLKTYMEWLTIYPLGEKLTDEQKKELGLKSINH